MRLEDLGIIGNCQFSALVESSGEVVWCCLPRFDSEPVFSTLLDAAQGGRFAVGPADGQCGQQSYLENTNILKTTFDTPSGAFQVLDFAPRFVQYDRAFRPTQMFRIVEPLEGSPRIRVTCEPRLGWSKGCPVRVNGSNHIEFEGFESRLRLTTDIPVSYLTGQPFTLTGRRHLVLTWGSPVEEPLQSLADRFLNETQRYWQRWVKQCNIPPLYQKAVIRSALALKLHCFEDSGAIIAAMTTSIPEARGQRSHMGLPLLLASRCLLCFGRLPAAGAIRRAREFHPLSIEHRGRGYKPEPCAIVLRGRRGCSRGANPGVLAGIWRRWAGSRRE